jgi:hypothetical protein
MAVVSDERSWWPPTRGDVAAGACWVGALFCFGLATFAAIDDQWGAAVVLAFIGVFAVAMPRMVGKWLLRAAGNEARGEFQRPDATTIPAQGSITERPQPPAVGPGGESGGPPSAPPESSTESDEG